MFVDVGLLIDNSSAETPYRLVQLWEHGKLRARPSEDPDPDT